MSRISQKLKDQKGFILFLLIFFIVRGSVADHYRVPTGSMIPNIQIGDHIFVNKLAYRYNLPFTEIGVNVSPPIPGEVVVFQHPKDDEIVLVKRLIAAQGDRVRIRDGYVWVNDESLAVEGSVVMNEDDFLVTEATHDLRYSVRRDKLRGLWADMDFTVPEGHYFFLGDNRDNSSDSRDWGFASEDLLIGRAETVLFSAVIEGFIPKFNLSRIGASLSQ